MKLLPYCRPRKLLHQFPQALAKFESPPGNFAKADPLILPALAKFKSKKADTVFYTMAACDGIIFKIID